MERLICVLVGYIFGLFQTSYLYGRIKKIDIRQEGSGNAGTTNALRTLGWKAGVITLVGDCMKCVLAVVVVKLIFADQKEVLNVYGIYAGLGAILGHNFPFYLGFKGGKGIAATGGLILATANPYITLILAIIFVITVAVSKYVSLGSIVLVVSYTVAMVISGQLGFYEMTQGRLVEMYMVAVALMLLAIYKHKENIKRLLNGTENKFGSKKEK